MSLLISLFCDSTFDGPINKKMLEKYLFLNKYCTSLTYFTGARSFLHAEFEKHTVN